MRARATLSIVATAAAAALTVLSAPYWISAFIYRPAALAPSAPKACGLVGAQDVDIRTGSADHLSALWFPPGDGAAVVLIAHGRSANVCTRASTATQLHRDGFGVLVFDYRGYGRSSGRPSEAGLTEDAVSAYDWLRLQGVGARRIIVLGQSLGDAPAAQLSAARPVAALVLVSPFTSLPGAMADRLGWPLLERLPWRHNRFEVAESLNRLHAPVLFIVSRQDGLVPYANSRRAARSARRPRWLEVDGLRHDGLLAAVARDGRLSRALATLVPKGG
jgi:hypothetical protein